MNCNFFQLGTQPLPSSEVEGGVVNQYSQDVRPRRLTRKSGGTGEEETPTSSRRPKTDNESTLDETVARSRTHLIPEEEDDDLERVGLLQPIP